MLIKAHLKIESAVPMKIYAPILSLKSGIRNFVATLLRGIGFYSS